MMEQPQREQGAPSGDAYNPMEALYDQLARSAARLMVVHEAGRIMSSGHDAQELAEGLLSTIAEALYASSGCVARISGEELEIMAARGFSEHELDELASSPVEAACLFTTADEERILHAEEIAELTDLEAAVAEGEADEFEDEPITPADDAGEPLAEAALETEQDLDLESDPGDDFVSDHDDDFVPDHEDDDFVPDYDQEGDEPAVSTASVAIDDEARPRFELYVPLKVQDEILGVMALGARVDGEAYGKEELEFAGSLASHLSVALNSARLFSDKERQIEQLSVLLRISKEITSTLDIERVLTTLCHMMGLLVGSRRVVVALSGGGRPEIRASSIDGFVAKEAKNDPLVPILEWSMGHRQPMNLTRESLELDEEGLGRDIILPYMQGEGGPGGIAILPLVDDEGLLGFLAIERDEDEEVLDAETDELVGILANQATVAIRNAELYQRVPMIGVLEPLFGKTRTSGGKWSRTRTIQAVAGVVLLVGFLVPVPAWVSSDASLRPLHPIAIRSATEGIVEDVLVEEGQLVTAGATLATLRSDPFTTQLEQLRAHRQRAQAEAARARGTGDLAGYRAKQAELLEIAEEEQYLASELQRTRLIAPVDGVVLTPWVELKGHQSLRRGETLLEMADLSVMEAEVLVAEADVDEIRVGSSARLKVHAYPGRTFRGEVVGVAPRADGVHEFRASIQIENADGALRPGMTGRAHVDIPNRPFLTSVFRPMFRWFRLKYWV